MKFMSHEVEKDYRAFCRECPLVDIWNLYVDLETNDDNYNEKLYQRIECGLVEWVKENTTSRVFYNGDLDFEFESESDRNLFDEVCGDPVAFKLTWL